MQRRRRANKNYGSHVIDTGDTLEETADQAPRSQAWMSAKIDPSTITPSEKEPDSGDEDDDALFAKGASAGSGEQGLFSRSKKKKEEPTSAADAAARSQFVENVFYNSAKARRTWLGRLHYCTSCPNWSKATDRRFVYSRWEYVPCPCGGCFRVPCGRQVSRPIRERGTPRRAGRGRRARGAS